MNTMRDFLAHHFEVESSGCWRWTKDISKEGYAEITHMGKKERANHTVWRAWKIFLPVGKKYLTRTCRNKLCVNPDHMTPMNKRDLNRFNRQRLNDEIAAAKREGRSPNFNSKLSKEEIDVRRQNGMLRAARWRLETKQINEADYEVLKQSILNKTHPYFAAT